MDARAFAQARADKLAAAMGDEDAPEVDLPEEPEEAPEGAAADAGDSPDRDDDEGHAAQEGEPDDAAAPSDEPEEPDDEAAAAVDAADAAEAELGEDATAEEIAEARDAAVSEFYVGRYKTREAAEEAYAEKDETIKRLYAEREQLKAQVRQQPAAQQDQLDEGEWRTWAQETIAEGGGQQGALAALKAGGMAGYQLYLEEWSADEDSRSEALAFNTALMQEIAQARPAQPAEPQEDPADRHREARELVLIKRPDLPEYEDAMIEVVDKLDAPTREWLKQQAAQGVHGEARVLDYLYLEARSASPGTKSLAAAKEAERRASSARRAKVGATVASAEATPGRTPLSEADQRVLDMVNKRREVWGLEPKEQ
jgi:hypothetical protein